MKSGFLKENLSVPEEQLGCLKEKLRCLKEELGFPEIKLTSRN